MRRAIKQKLGDRRGELYLDVLLSLFAVCLCISLALAALPVFITKMELNTVAKDTARFIEIAGSTSGYENTAKTASEKVGLDFDRIQVSCSKSGDLQLQDDFAVTLTMKVDFNMGGFARFDVNISSTATGRSEVYRKP